MTWEEKLQFALASTTYQTWFFMDRLELQEAESK